ncbi:type IV toxin-antitoxin system AbiEi family antitoxin [Leifsonia sp. 2TAF2]|uniref:type IV toxin-antitoxin system AbiEi family antitoxin n=1 Tax=Leifsonia sp. 2TAF2 TaxID=3233009 RepID=UPI003F99AD8B
MTSISPPLLDTGVLPVVELLALCLDGHLFQVGDEFAPVGTPDGPDLRAQAFARSVPLWAVADRGSAAWIHGTRALPPPIPQVCVPLHRRGGMTAPSVDVSHRALGTDDTQSFAAVRVTTPLRTACDLLSVSTTFGDAEALEVRHLLALAAVTPAELDELLRASRRKGSGLARSRMPAVARAVLPLSPVSPR